MAVADSKEVGLGGAEVEAGDAALVAHGNGGHEAGVLLAAAAAAAVVVSVFSGDGSSTGRNVVETLGIVNVDDAFGGTTGYKTHRSVAGGGGPAKSGETKLGLGFEYLTGLGSSGIARGEDFETVVGVEVNVKTPGSGADGKIMTGGVVEFEWTPRDNSVTIDFFTFKHLCIFNVLCMVCDVWR